MQTGWIDEDFEKVVVPFIPMVRLISPTDIGETILFLSSEQARMITGQVIKVSGEGDVNKKLTVIDVRKIALLSSSAN